jgi:DNA-binding Lrp family transcriptional regulator
MAITTTTFDQVDQALLTQLQQPLAIDHRPFQVLGEKLGLSEQVCLERVERLKATATLRFISGSFDAEALGYDVSLVAMHVPRARTAEALHAFQGYPGTAHLHALDDPFLNVWGTVILPPKASLSSLIRALHGMAAAEETVALPVVRLYKGRPARDEVAEECWLKQPETLEREARQPSRHPATELTPRDLRLIRVAQEDLPLLEIPYAVWAEQADCSEEDVFDWLKRMEHFGVLRGIMARLSPQALTKLTSMTVAWRVPLGRVDLLGEQMADVRDVAYCYRRPLHPSWPYPLFTVIRAADPASCLDAAQRLNIRFGPFPYKALVVEEAEPAQKRVTFFNPALETWWRQYQ